MRGLQRGDRGLQFRLRLRLSVPERIALDLDAFKRSTCTSVVACGEGRLNALEKHRGLGGRVGNEGEAGLCLHHGSSRIHRVGQAPTKSTGLAQPFNGFNMGEKVPWTRLDQTLQRFPSRSSSAQRCRRTQGAKVVLCSRRQALKQGWIGPSHGPFKGAPFAVQATNFCRTFLRFPTEDQHVTEQAERLDEVDLIGDLASALCPKLADQIAGHDLRDFLASIGKVALELDEDLPGIAHPKHDARS